MPKITSQTEFEVLIEIISSMHNGASVSDLMANSDLSYSRRTLQRRLESLVTNHTIEARGEGRGRRYFGAIILRKDHFHNRISLQEGEVSYGSRESSSQWLSAEALELKQRIQRPVAQREPVGYNADFLLDYIPNETFYLPEQTRTELAQLGKVGVSELPAGTYLRHLLDRLIIDLSWNSSRLEGNTYSLLDTERLLKLGENVAGKATEETQMLLNHKAAIEMLADQAWELGFNRYTICNLHALLSENLMSNFNASGTLRSMAVGIGQSVFYPLEVPQLIEEYFLTILEKAEAIEDPFEAAFFVMVQLPYLQPFEDVNKRTSRLSANIPMVQKNYCPLSFVDVETEDYLNAMLTVYELNKVDYLRDLFVWAYKRSCKRYTAIRNTLGSPDPFQLKYRCEIKDCVRKVALSCLAKEKATEAINEYVENHLPEKERKPFSLIVKAQLESLHEGNIARFKLRPSELQRWQTMQ